MNDVGCVFQQNRRLVCVDVLTGQLHWSRDDLSQGCDLFGDRRYVVAVPRGTTTARVFDMVDGREIGTRTIPAWKERLATRGAKVIAWRRDNQNSEQTLLSFDVVSGEKDWEHRFDRRAVVDVAANRFVAVSESGRLRVVDASDGRVLVDQEHSREEKPAAIHLIAGPDCLVLATHYPDSKRRVTRRNGLLPADYPEVSGPVFCFDRRSGQPLWQRPAEVHNQRLMLTQPSGLPVLVFAGQSPTEGSNPRDAGIDLLVLERATGRLLFHNENMDASSKLDVSVSDSDPNEIMLSTKSSEVRLRFTQGHRPPEPPFVDDGKRPAEGGLYRVLEGLFSGT